MATKSIYKNISVKNRSFCRTLVSALENAQKKKAKDVQLSRTFSEVKNEDIKSIFGDTK
ncbi:MAG: hypothetical protein IJG16_06525 [Clostridia bacterium]|nr:hypothetical protein [Clostridia bacterium]